MPSWPCLTNVSCIRRQRSVEVHCTSRRSIPVEAFVGDENVHEVVENPDMLIGIADWKSVEAREAHMHESAATGAYAPLLEMLAAPFRATVIKQLP